MQIRSTARASALAVAIAAAGFTLLPHAALAAASQAVQIEQQLAAYRRDRTELERSIEQAEAAITRARAAGDTRALNAAIAQRGRLRAELRALDATVRIVAGIAKDGAAATATYDGTLQALQGRVSDSATALRLAKDELAAASAGRSELSVAEATQALQLAARQYRNARITATSFAANSAEIEAVATAARTSSRAAAAPKKSGTDSGSGSSTTTSTGKGRKSTGTTTETTESSATLLVTPTSTTTESTTGSTELQTSTVESDSVFATLAAIAESGSTTTTTATTEPVQEPAILEEPAPLIDPEPAPAPEPEPDTAPTTVEADPQTLLVESADTTAEPTGTTELPGDPVETDTTLADAEIDALLAEPEPAPATEEPAPEPEALGDAIEPVPTSVAEAEPTDAELDAMIAGEPAPTETPTTTEPAPEPVSEPLTQPVVDEPVVATTEPAPAVVSEPDPEPTTQPQPVIATGTATLSWSVPVTRANGAPLAMSELRGYELYVMAESTGESQVITIDDPLAASYTVGQLAPDTYHFAIAAVDSEQRLSELSEVVSKTIADTSVASAP